MTYLAISQKLLNRSCSIFQHIMLRYSVGWHNQFHWNQTRIKVHFLPLRPAHLFSDMRYLFFLLQASGRINNIANKLILVMMTAGMMVNLTVLLWWGYLKHLRHCTFVSFISLLSNPRPGPRVRIQRKQVFPSRT